LERWYEPEDLDMDSAPTFSSLEDLIELGNEMVATAINQRAQDIKAELVQDFFWVRLDFPTESHHHFFRCVSAPAQNQELASERDVVMEYAAAH
jgi:hypothetical protein